MWQTFNYSLLLIYKPRKDERLNWPCWLTYSALFTHISDHPSAVDRAQCRGKFAGQRPTFYHCATQPTSEGIALILCVALFVCLLSRHSVAFGVILSLLFVCFFVCFFVCTVEDISTQDSAIGVKFWLRVEQTS